MTEHLVPGDVLDFSMGLLEPVAQGLLELHLADCAPCQSMAAEALKASSLPGAQDEAPRAPVQVGRFVVLRSLGAGAMGLVFEAHDPQLDRKVALKLRRGRDEAGAAERVLHEARAMARLSHPNIIAVHEVGVADDELFLVMELATGTTLWDFSVQHRRQPQRVLEAFAQAGRGLAAAHREGVVHRDFKPENVLVDGTGRVRVTDFGVASLAAAESHAGTPVYMAPEVLAKAPATAASDQFSFCAALYEALDGRRPWRGPRELQREGPAARLKHGSARVRRALARGLSLDPAERYPSMNALLAELEGPARPAPLSRAAVVVAFVLALASIGFTVVERAVAKPAPAPASLECRPAFAARP